MEQTHPVEKVVTHNLTRTGVSLSFLFAFTFPVTTHFQPIPHSQLTSSPLSLGHSKCTGRSKHPTYDSIHPRVLRTKIVVKVKKGKELSRNEGKVIKGTITGIQFNIKCGYDSHANYGGGHSTRHIGFWSQYRCR